MIRRPPRSTLFPSTPLFQSITADLQTCTAPSESDHGRSAPTTMKRLDRKSTRLNSSHSQISYAVFCLKKKTNDRTIYSLQQHRSTMAAALASSSDGPIRELY